MVHSENKPLRGKVAVGAGATRGCGRGIAVELGAAGATVYCTGRSVRGQASPSRRPETIDGTAERVTAAGGVGIAVQVDHSVEEQVKALFERIGNEQGGRLDILVNDIGGYSDCSSVLDWNTPMWELDAKTGLRWLESAAHTHIITSRWGIPLMVPHNHGLVIEVGDGTGYDYRGTFYYSLAKVSVIHTAEAIAADLRERSLTGITALALTPGYLRSEQMLENFGVREENWRDAITKDPDFARSETPRYIGRAVVALASDPDVHSKAGQALATWRLVGEYGFTDVDGSQPRWKKDRP